MYKKIIKYWIFHRSVFPTLKDFHSHKLCCENFQNLANKSAKLESMSVSAVPRVRTLKHNVGKKPDFAVEVKKSWTLILDSEEENQKPEEIATNLWGRRLPKRTKVPYLSRAIPLSTDHSYERCQCGAVFVTRVGKRQHQARFCTFSKNKSKKSQNNETVVEGTEANQVSQLCTVKNEFVENDNYDIFMKTECEHYIIQTEEIGPLLK